MTKRRILTWQQNWQTPKTGSVITRDNAISVFAELSRADEEYEKVVFPVLLEHLRSCKPSQIGQHAERAFVCVNDHNAAEFAAVLSARREHLTDAQKKRADALLKKLGRWCFKR
jgi:hypothetical protein